MKDEAAKRESRQSIPSSNMFNPNNFILCNFYFTFGCRKEMEGQTTAGKASTEKGKEKIHEMKKAEAIYSNDIEDPHHEIAGPGKEKENRQEDQERYTINNKKSVSVIFFLEIPTVT